MIFGFCAVKNNGIKQAVEEAPQGFFDSLKTAAICGGLSFAMDYFPAAVV